MSKGPESEAAKEDFVGQARADAAAPEDGRAPSKQGTMVVLTRCD